MPQSETANTLQHKTNGEIKTIREQCREILRKPDAEITEEDKAILSQYEGAGGIDEENRTTSGVLNGFYTPQNLVEKVWEIADRYALMPLLCLNLQAASEDLQETELKTHSPCTKKTKLPHG